MSWGGKRIGAGRKSKSQEVQLIEQLSMYDALAIEELIKGIKRGDVRCLQLWFNYRLGKPTETQNVNLVQEQPTYEVIVLDNDSESSD
jgi:hypothetical protein|tara:strand:+ start:388 stop:651 length:264 start_codon:yes stop_codon:yes gene_type:complete